MSRAYNREISRRKALNRRRLARKIYPYSDEDYYDNLHQYSKNKIHCSCRMCRGKDYYGRHIPTMQELRNGIGTKYPPVYEISDTSLNTLTTGKLNASALVHLDWSYPAPK